MNKARSDLQKLVKTLKEQLATCQAKLKEAQKRHPHKRPREEPTPQPRPTPRPTTPRPTPSPRPKPKAPDLSKETESVRNIMRTDRRGRYP